MFGFTEEDGYTKEDAEKLGSAGRFPIRIKKFIDKNKLLPYVQHYGWWLLHNCVAHFLLGLFPVKLFFRFHDWTSKKLNAE